MSFEARTGTEAYVQYKKEETFNTAVSPTNALGLDERISSLNYRNNQRKVSALNSTIAQTFAYGREEVDFGIDFIMSNPWWLEALLSKKTTDAVANGVTPHKFEPSHVLNGHSMEVGINFATPVVLKAAGAILQSASFSAQLGQPINVSTGWASGHMLAIGSTVTTDASDTEAFPYTFSQMKIEVPTATEITGVNSFNLNINPNANLVYNIGGKQSVSGYKGLLEISGSIERPMQDGSLLQDVIDRSEQTCTIEITNGETADGKEKSLTMVGTGLSFSDYSTSISIDDVVMESVQFEMRDLDITAKTSTTTSPY